MMRPLLVAAILVGPRTLRGQSPLPRWVDSLKAMRVVHLGNGPNSVNLIGKGDSGVVWRAWRDNNNAHGYDHYAFYVPGAGTQDLVGWQLVPILPRHSATYELDSYRTENGA